MQPSSANNARLRLDDFTSAAVARLKDADIESADLDARILIAHGLKLDRAQLLTQGQRELSHKEFQELTSFIECRARHEPVARIIGEREFWSLPFGLNEATLEPRPDSETLVETVLKKIKDKNDNFKIIDLGTGTGCLLLSLLHELPNATGFGVDIVPRAVEQAEANAQNLRLDNRASFMLGNWLDKIDSKFDIIISNPPYISWKEIPELMPEVREFDPMQALDGGKDGLEPYRAIIPFLSQHLRADGIIAFEIGKGQATAVSAMLKDYYFIGIETHKDLGGIERVVTAHLDKNA
ncbi:MAG TPA: peptide chain release factor N(5)-glutamine methyltransferase [Alphaproteobacteria bacterium]|nr:peptide chain release factor N(5)-glutamine methyltransferase [Alphaproteobacteria bacterium]